MIDGTQEVLATLDPIAAETERLDKLVKRAELHLDWCKNSRDRRESEDRWRDVKNFWQSRQWDGLRSFGIPGRNAETKKLHPCPVDNFFKAQLEGLIGDITDRPADIQIRPTEPDDEGRAQKMERTIQHIWYVNNGDRKIEYAARSAVQYGPLIAKVYWDNDYRGSKANPFIGEVRFFSVSPANIFVDPRVKAVEDGVIQRAEFVIYAVRRSLAYVRKHYPETGYAVQADTYATYVDALDENTEEISPDDTEVLVLEYWYRGEPLAGDFASPTFDFDDDHVDDGVHVAIIAGGVLLKHTTNAYPWYPFVMEHMYPSEETIYGYSDGYDILLPQLVMNKLNEIAIEGAALASKGNWVTDEGNIRNRLQYQKYAAMGGAVLSAVDSTKIKRELGGNVPGSLFTHYRQEQQAMEAVTGRFDINQGRAPRGVRAASAIALLLQQGAGRIRQRSRAMSSFIQQIIKMMVELVGAFYTEERVIRIVGREGLEWESVSTSDFSKQVYGVDPETGMPTQDEYVPEFDIRVISGADTTASKAYYAELAMQLYQAQVIDEIALMEILEFPRWREVLNRKQQAAMEMAQAEAQQQQGGQVQMQQAGMPPMGGGGMPPMAGGGGMPPQQGMPQQGGGDVPLEVVVVLMLQMGMPLEQVVAVLSQLGYNTQRIAAIAQQFGTGSPSPEQVMVGGDDEIAHLGSMINQMQGGGF